MFSRRQQLPWSNIKAGETGHKGGVLLPEKADEFRELLGEKNEICINNSHLLPVTRQQTP